MATGPTAGLSRKLPGFRHALRAETSTRLPQLARRHHRPRPGRLATVSGESALNGAQERSRLRSWCELMHRAPRKWPFYATMRQTCAICRTDVQQIFEDKSVRVRLLVRAEVCAKPGAGISPMAMGSCAMKCRALRPLRRPSVRRRYRSLTSSAAVAIFARQVASSASSKRNESAGPESSR